MRASHAAEDRTCVLYSLADLGNDPDLGQWVAEAIPAVIAPGTWDGKGVLRYYGPKNILLVCHTPAVQAKVSSFLQDVRKCLPRGNGKHLAASKPPAGDADAGVISAAYRTTSLVPAPQSVPGSNSSYPVPALTRPPKHLFHFIIRYEGEGIVDNNVVKAIKAQYQADNKKDKEEKEPSPTPSARTSASAPDPLVAPTVAPSLSGTSPTKEDKKAGKPDKEESKEDKKAGKPDKEDQVP